MLKLSTAFVTAVVLSTVSVQAECISGCGDLPNNFWSYGTPTVETDTKTKTETRDFNRAAEASGGRASDRNRSDFRETTTQETTTTTTTTPALNPQGKVVEDKARVEETVTVGETTTTVEKIK